MQRIRRYNVLWIEDESLDLARQAAAVFSQVIYRMRIARTATEAVKLLSNDLLYDAIIVDMRLEPGDDDHWRQLSQRRTRGGQRILLGQQLIYSLLGHEEAVVRLQPKPPVEPHLLAVMTVEPLHHIQEFMQQIGLDPRERYVNKTDGLAHDALLQLIQRIVQ